MNNTGTLRFFAHPMVIAAILTVAALPFMLAFIPRYVIKISTTGIIDKPDGRMLWHDLNGDGESEHLVWFINSENKATIKVLNQTGFLIDQQVYNGQALILRNYPNLYEKKKGENPELISFYHRNDSLFMLGIHYSADFQKSVGKEIFFSSLANHSANKDYNIGLFQTEDMDGDSINELIFGIYAGYPYIPRNIFIFNPSSQIVIQSDFLGATSNVSSIADVNRDGKKEIVLYQYAPGNMPDSLKNGANDHEVKLLVLTDQLKPLFHPHTIEGIYSGLQAYPVFHDKRCLFVALNFNVANYETDGTLMIFSNNGELLRQKKLYSFSNRKLNHTILNPGNSHEINIFVDEGMIRTFDISLRETGNKKMKILKGSHLAGEIDIDEDGEIEKLFISDCIIITRDNLNQGAKVRIPVDMLPIEAGFHIKRNTDKPDEMVFQSKNRYFFVTYFRNPLFPLRFLAGIVYWGLCYGFVFLVQYLQSLSLREKYMAERKVSELQLLLVRNQISPHFLFNAINSINYWIMVKNPVEANNSIVRLSRLIRSNLVSAERLSRSLKEEVEAVTVYLEIVCSQLENPFSFSVNIDPEVNKEVQVPVLVIQNYVENAAKHGVRTLGKEGRIDIHISMNERNLVIVISDNGIGRQQSGKMPDKPESTGKGIGLMQQFFDIVNKFNSQKIIVNVSDLYNDKQDSRGTRVELNIPQNFKYRLYE